MTDGRAGLLRMGPPSGPRMNRHRALPAWLSARELVIEIYALTRRLPSHEQFVAVPQLRRAAWSVANNIAEGNARRGRGELRQFFNTAIGSLLRWTGWRRSPPARTALTRSRCRRSRNSERRSRGVCTASFGAMHGDAQFSRPHVLTSSRPARIPRKSKRRANSCELPAVSAPVTRSQGIDSTCSSSRRRRMD